MTEVGGSFGPLMGSAVAVDVQQSFARLCARHADLPGILREERELRADLASCPLMTALSDSGDRTSVRELRRLQASDGRATTRAPKNSSALSGQLQLLLQDLGAKHAAGEDCRGSVESLQGLMDAALELGGSEAAGLRLHATRLLAGPPGGLALLTLPLTVLHGLVELRLTSYEAIVASLALQPSAAKNYLTDILAALTEIRLPQTASPSTATRRALSTTHESALSLGAPATVAAAQFSIALVSHAYVDQPSSNTAAEPQLSKCKEFSSKVLRILSLKIFKHLLQDVIEAKAPVKLPESCSSDVGYRNTVLLPGRAGCTSTCRDLVHCSCNPMVQFYDFLLASAHVLGMEAVSNFLSWQLGLFLTFQPEVQLPHVLQNQALYSSAALDPLLHTVLHKMCVGVGAASAVQVLDTVVRSQEVNWAVVLPLLSTLVNASSNAADKIRELIQDYMKSGCAEEELELCILGLLFARQCCREGAHVFPPYPHWFAATFGGVCTPAPGKKEFTFLMRFLTELVPHESALHLRTHATQRVHAPRSCQHLLRDYQTLARARLRDLEGEEAVSDQGAVEARLAVEQYRLGGRVPKGVLEAAMFRKTHYNAVFLPALLQPRRGQQDDEARQELVQALWTAGKIPTAAHQRYLAALASREEAGDTATPPECSSDAGPLPELNGLLLSIVNAAGADDRTVLPLLARVADCIESTLRSADAVYNDSPAVDVSVSLPLIGMADKILSMFCDRLSDIIFEHSANQPDYSCSVSAMPRPSWVPQLVALLAGSYSLQASLARYWRRLVLKESPSTAEELASRVRKLHVSGVLFCEVSQLEGLFLPVVGATSTTEAPPLHFLSTLPLETADQCWAASRILNAWLSWHQRHFRPPSSTPGSLQPPAAAFDTPTLQSPLLQSACSVYHCLWWWLTSASNLLSPLLLQDTRGLGWSNSLLGNLSKPSLSQWLQFESTCSISNGGNRYEERPRCVSGRLMSLQQRLASSYGTEDGAAVIYALLERLVDLNTKESNWSILLLLLQSRVVPASRSLVSVLRWWQQRTEATLRSAAAGAAAVAAEKGMKVKAVELRQENDGCSKTADLELFISVCQCLPPPMLVGDMSTDNTERAIALLIGQVKRASSSLHLPVALTSSLLAAALLPPSIGGDPQAERDQQLQHSTSLALLWQDALFQWSSVKWVFENRFHTQNASAEEVAFPILAELWNCLRKEASVTSHVTDLGQVSSELSMYYLLGVVLERLDGRNSTDAASVLSSVSLFTAWNLPGGLRPMYLTRLAAHVGEKVFCGEVAFFPVTFEAGLSKESGGSSSEFVSSSVGYNRLLNHFKIELTDELGVNADGLLKTLSYIPNHSIRHYYHIFGIVHACLLVYGDKETRVTASAGRSSGVVQVLLQSHAVLVGAYETDDHIILSEERPAKRSRLSASRNRPAALDALDYLTRLSVLIQSVLSSVSEESLRQLPANLLEQCDQEIQATVRRRLGQKER